MQKKTLWSTLPRLQRMLMRIQDYECTLTYRPGRDMILAESLSRLPDPTDVRYISMLGLKELTWIQKNITA